ncbi:uncharacterized protein EV420DRAFT_1281161, partial [Desarmillaria tabescens]
VWDLYSNRVVPWWCTGIPNDGNWMDQLRPISHAWMDEKDHVNEWTPINRYEWPVPIPKDTNLNLICIEMLNLDGGYVWLDVLCLRQEGGLGEESEDMRMEEWELDVPTIGAVYHTSWNVVCYLSGLGQPLSLKEGDLDSDRSWFRRAWTLEEIGDKRVIAGDTPDGPLHAEDKDGEYETELLARFHKQLQSMKGISYGDVCAVLKSMQKRVSTNPVDKVAGLAFLMGSEMIPAYHESQSLEEAWVALMNSVDVMCQGQLFFLCPEPGNAGTKWRPSWDQVMMKSLPEYDFAPNIQLYCDETGNEDWCSDVVCIEKGSVRGLAVVEGSDRHGELIVKDEGGIEHRFEIMATHTYSIPEDTYTLISASTELTFPRYGWVVGRSLPGGKFEKVSVLEIPDEEYYRLGGLCITDWGQYILI